MNILKNRALGLLSAFGLTSLVHANPVIPSEAMKALRLQALSEPASQFGLEQSNEFPQIFGVLIDFPIDQETATIVSLIDGTASLYTTSTFGIIGGGNHDKVRVAAKKLVLYAKQFLENAIEAKTYPYPKEGNVRFYFLTFDGVKVIEEKLPAIESNDSKYSLLFWQGQEVLTELRLSAEVK